MVRGLRGARPPRRFAGSAKVGHPLAIMLGAIAIGLFALAAPPELISAAPAAIHAEIRKPGASAVLVNVWATWCAPCREEFPDLLHVARDFKARGLRLVLVSADFEGMESEARQFLSSQGVDFPSFIKAGKDEDFVDGLEAKWSGALPATFVYDGEGRLVRFWEGKASYPVIKRRVLEALAPKELP